MRSLVRPDGTVPGHAVATPSWRTELPPRLGAQGREHKARTSRYYRKSGRCIIRSGDEERALIAARAKLSDMLAGRMLGLDIAKACGI